MGDNRTYLPGIHCAVHVQLGGKHIAATKSVEASDGRIYQLCDDHAHVFDVWPDYVSAVHNLRPTQPKGQTA